MSTRHNTGPGMLRLSARQYMITGLGGVAMAGVGGLLALPSATPGPMTVAVRLASVGEDAPLAPPTGESCDLVFVGCDVGAVNGSSYTPTTNAIVSAGATARPSYCGLVCNGADGSAETPDGQNGGLWWGNGGNGINGGDGGNGGRFGGDGGSGGAGADALYDGQGGRL